MSKIHYSDPVCEGCVTNLFCDGEEVSDPREATHAVVEVFSGKDAGSFIVVALDDAEFYRKTFH
jgi:hypothetical protein